MAEVLVYIHFLFLILKSDDYEERNKATNRKLHVTIKFYNSWSLRKKCQGCVKRDKISPKLKNIHSTQSKLRQNDLNKSCHWETNHTQCIKCSFSWCWQINFGVWNTSSYVYKEHSGIFHICFTKSPGKFQDEAQNLWEETENSSWRHCQISACCVSAKHFSLPVSTWFLSRADLKQRRSTPTTPRNGFLKSRF